MSKIVIIPEGTSSPGCREITDGCYFPDKISMQEGDKIRWQNNDSTGHTITSGSPKSGSDGLFGSGMIKPDEKFFYIFDDFEPGKYSYYCEIHPWQIGTIVIQKGHEQEI